MLAPPSFQTLSRRIDFVRNEKKCQDFFLRGLFLLCVFLVANWRQEVLQEVDGLPSHHEFFLEGRRKTKKRTRRSSSGGIGPGQGCAGTALRATTLNARFHQRRRWWIARRHQRRRLWPAGRRTFIYRAKSISSRCMRHSSHKVHC